MTSTAATLPGSWEELPYFNTGMPWLGSSFAFMKDPLGFYLKPYREIGPVFRSRFFGRMSLVMAGLEANEYIWSSSEQWDYSVRGAIFRENFDETYLTQLTGDPHRKKRRRMNPAFKPSAIMPHTPVMSEVLFGKIDQLPEGRTDLRKLCRSLIVAMTGQTLLQANLPEGMDERIAHFEHELLMGGLFGPFRNWWYGRKSYVENREIVFKMIGELLDEREKNPPTRPDAIKLMLQDIEPGEPIPSRQELIYDVAMMFLAGSDSTSSVILWALLFIYHDPEWLAELREELKAWKPDQFTSMGDFPKLKATVMETERLRPPFPVFFRTPLTDVTYKGMTIPKGTPILHIISLPHFLDEIYENARAFNPRRFLGEQAYPVKAHGIFGGGSHVCLGQPLARVQEPLAIANIVQNYDIEFDFKPSFHAAFSAVATPSEKALPVRFVRRKMNS